MVTMKKETFAYLVFGILVAGVIGYHTPSLAAEQKTETYVMVVFLKGSEFFNWAYAGMGDAAKLIGPHVQVDLQGPTDWDATAESRTIMQLIARGVDGILTTAGEATIMQPAIDKAIENGIPVITFDSDSPTSKRQAFVGTNNYEAGRLAGRTMAKWLNGKGVVGISTYIGPDHTARRVKGFKDALAEATPDIKTYEVNDEGRIDRAGPIIMEMLRAHPDITGLFCAHGNPGFGAAQAVRDLNLQGKVQIMAFDFGGVIIDLMDKGEIRGTVAQNPYLMGYYSLLLAYGAKHPTETIVKDVPLGVTPGFVDTGTTILGPENVDALKNQMQIYYGIYRK